jgi:hypothetical protein
MKHNRGYDEVMIVNPYDPQSTNQQTNLMTFNTTPEVGYYAAPTDYGYYADSPEMIGYYAAEPDAYGYYADQPEMRYYGDPGYGYYPQPESTYGYYGEPAMGHYGDQFEPVGYYADQPEMRYYGDPGYGYYPQPESTYGYYGEPAMGHYGDQFEPVGYYADEWPMGWYADSSDMSGYADYEPPLSDYPQGVGYYAEPQMAGYVRQTATPSYNPGCPIPTNVAGYGGQEQFSDGDPLSGYQRPKSVNASCEQFTPQPGVRDFVPETFKPLW